ncbi:two-component sensor histidine kinase [Vibrio sp. MACH09]|uniref:ATP-binding protein n=1 Tax=Vibrio sp. MACH09 TaxID=3025122 RepID=UPI0027945FFC|nr:ATP-binding protein [Vibrio sp. MACH09]GLO63505.1 two-component sensor histidine kinase [Vibrio sp. MACH09]
MSLKRIFPQSLVARTSLMLLMVILVAQLLAGLIWFQQSAQKEQQGLKSTVSSLVLSASSTISFFSSLPLEYRHLVLNQLRNMGGTRFFVSLNSRELNVTPIPDSARKQLVLNEVRKVLEQELGNENNITVEFTTREELKVFSSGINIDDLPLLWAHYSLSFGDINPPILVIQIEVSPQEWFYLAAVLPAPYVSLESSFMDSKQIFFMILSALMLLVFTWLVIRSEIRPIRNLAKAATLMGSKLSVPEVKEEGSSELKAAVHAFNKMNRRVKSHLREREMLFGAISHDLKTPLACLKLRTEMLEDDVTRARFEKLLNEVDLMVKGALQCIRETDIHEDIESIDLNDILNMSTELYNRYAKNVTINGYQIKPYYGKPLAIKRCIQNLVDNGVKYGKEVAIEVEDSPSQVIMTFIDQGPGIDKKLLAKVFEPYYRVSSNNQEGSGLGLTIARSIARAHGGEVTLHSRTEEQPFAVRLVLSRD